MEPNQQIEILHRQTTIDSFGMRVDMITLSQDLEFRSEVLRGFQGAVTKKGEHTYRPLITTSVVSTNTLSVVHARDSVYLNAEIADGKGKSVLLRKMTVQEAANPDVQKLSLLIGKYLVNIQQIVTAPPTSLPDRADAAKSTAAQDSADVPAPRKSKKAAAQPEALSPSINVTSTTPAAALSALDEQNVSHVDEPAHQEADFSPNLALGQDSEPDLMPF